MKTEVIDNEKYIIYLNKYYVNNKDIFNKDVIEKYLKKIFLHLQKYYNLDIYGYFEINCFINNNYGIILEIEEDSIDFPFYSKKTDMRITFYDNEIFLYNIDNYFIKDILDKDNYKLHIKDNEYYIEIININYKDIAYIIENSKRIIYGKDVLEIIKN